MKIVFAPTGRTTEAYVANGCDIYEKRLSRYVPFLTQILPITSGQTLPPSSVIQRESEAQLKLISNSDYTVLLDEGGIEFTSVEFSKFLQQRMNQGIRQLNFIVGGAYGFDQEVKQKASFKLALSKMTFPHQLVRLLFMEQLYRAFTILKNEPYHHI